MGSISKSSTTEASAGEDIAPFSTLDQVIRERAKTHKDKTLISYPALETDFVDYTGDDIDRMTRYAAGHYSEALAHLSLELDPPISAQQKIEGCTIWPNSLTVALVGISSLEYYITFLALQRLGITTMFISPRLAEQGHCHLLNKTGCSVAIASGSSYVGFEQIRNGTDLLVGGLALVAMIDRHFIMSSLAGAKGVNDSIDLAFLNAGDDQGFIIHSGGTTGLPKPVPLKASAWLLQAHRMVRRNPPANTLSTLPLFHSFGLVTLLRGLVGGTRVSILNAARPVTAKIIQDSLDLTDSQALVTVPYTLKCVAEADGGLQRLGRLREVINAGSAVPDELGDKVVAAGTNIFHFYGQTECGALMEPPEDRLLWSWVTPLPHAAPYLRFQPEESSDQSLYHLFVLPGLKQKVFSDQPDGSYATKDLFQRHPSNPSLWKFVARKDDIIVLVNGEKADPIPIEDAVMTNPNVKVAVAFGAGHESLGLIVIKSENGSRLPDEQFLQSIAPNIQLGNSRVPAFARLAEDLVILKDKDTQYPATDKSTVIRPLFLKMFDKDIERAFFSRQGPGRGPQSNGTVVLNSEIMAIVSNAVQDQLSLKFQTGNHTANQPISPIEISSTTDFFDLGLDSLQASNIRSRLLKEVNLFGGNLALNVVFDHPNVELLTQHLIQVRSGNLKVSEDMDAEALAQEMLQKYSHFGDTRPGTDTSQAHGENVLLTGATGQIGAHVLFHLLKNDQVLKVFCVVRASNEESALERIIEALESSRLKAELPIKVFQKLEVHRGDMADPSGRFGLTDSAYHEIRNSVTVIIHNAWSVNFNMSLQSFETQSIRPTFHLIQLALSSPLMQKPRFTFVSSIATILRGASEPDSKVAERRYGWSEVGEMGYGQSKWVAEGICVAAAEETGLSTRVARLGQIVGDTKHGNWKSTEAYPTLTQSALTLGILPLIEPSSSGAVHDQCYWLPVDIAAAGVVEIALHDITNATGSSIFHITNTKPISWNTQYLPAVQSALQSYGIEFETLPQRQWLQRLEDSDLDITKNPTKKLLAFFKDRYGSVHEQGEPALDMTRACAVAPFLEKNSNIGLDDQLLTKFVTYWMEQCWG